MRIELAADDDITAMLYANSYPGDNVYVKDLLDPENGIYVCEQFMPQDGDEIEYVQMALCSVDDDEIRKEDISYLIREDADIGLVEEYLESERCSDISLEYADADALSRW